MSTPTDLDAVLVDVRRAYRLLHDYQRLVLDSLRFVASQLQLDYLGGYPKFSSAAPGNGRGSLDSWSWDWLNLVFYDFTFSRQVGDGRLHVAFILISDTGYFMSGESAIPQKTETFVAAEESASKVCALLYWDWPQSHDVFFQKLHIADLVRSGNLPSQLSDGGVRAKLYEVSDFVTEAAASRTVDSLIAFAVREKFPLVRIGGETTPVA